MKTNKLDYLLSEAIAEAKKRRHQNRLFNESIKEELLTDDDMDFEDTFEDSWNEDMIDLSDLGNYDEDWDNDLDGDEYDNEWDEDLNNYDEDWDNDFDQDEFLENKMMNYDHLFEDDDLEKEFEENGDVIADEDKLEQRSLSERIKRELKNAYKIIEETNKINSQLLHALKILYEFDLSKDEKDKVISELARTNTIEEAKRKYLKLLENLGGRGKPHTYASKPIASTKPLTEATDPMVLRMQKLAGIIK